MLKRITIKDWRLTFTCAKIAKVVGVNSHVNGDLHIAMWDFDHVPLEQVQRVLLNTQVTFALPTIYIAKTSEPDNYIAYCFCLRHFKEICQIVMATPYVCWNFLKFGIYRGRFTLRVGAKAGKEITHASILNSPILPSCCPNDLKSWVQYETLAQKGGL